VPGALDALRDGRGMVRTVTIPEGFALTQIVPLLTTRLGLPVDSVTAAVRDTAPTSPSSFTPCENADEVAAMR